MQNSKRVFLAQCDRNQYVFSAAERTFWISKKASMRLPVNTQNSDFVQRHLSSRRARAARVELADR